MGIRTPSTITGTQGDRAKTMSSPKGKQLGMLSSNGHSAASKKLTTVWALSRSVCVSAETPAAPNATKGVEEDWPAGPARPGSSPAASLTADWLHSWLVSALDLPADSKHSAPVAGHPVCGGMGSIRVGRRRSISRPVGPGVTQHQTHGTRCGSPADRRRSIQDDGTAARRW